MNGEGKNFTPQVNFKSPNSRNSRVDQSLSVSFKNIIEAEIIEEASDGLKYHTSN